MMVISSSMTAQHNGYRKIGLLHSRKLTVCEDGQWEVIDRLAGSPDLSILARLHWLLPDWEYEIQEYTDQQISHGLRYSNSISIWMDYS